MNTRKPLDKSLRSGLERTVIKARDIAEKAATQALVRLAVGENKAPDYLNESQRVLRNQLRAHGRQLGDSRRANGEQGISKLVTEVAYEHWHRMLFAKFLEQNSLLMYDQYTPVTIDECNELVQDGVFQDELEEQCNSGWALAGVLASKMLPQIFRIDSPVFKLQFAPELQRDLEKLILGLTPETFQAQDSLGWVYQFWQSKRKDEVNKSEVKIGADELSPVTQLFTEPYMVSFLLDNSLGAWWAGKRLSQDDLANAQSEQELREKAAIPGVPLTYLRFVKENGQWQPASGFFEGWPDHLSELKTLDPCCGSGHFLVAAFLMLVPMRMEMEQLTAEEAVDKVLSENIHGLELDQRCLELAAFALALEAWRYTKDTKTEEAIGYRQLPELNLSCSGLSIIAAKDEWKALSKKAGKKNLTIALDWMYETFKDAPVLGSLINPKRLHSAKIAKWDELEQVLSETLEADETLKKNRDLETSQTSQTIEAGITAQGLVKAAKLLSSQYHWVITNVPYLARGKQSDTLRAFSETYYGEGKNDLATVFLDRCLEFCKKGGTSSIVLPQNWLFLTSYKKFREKLLKQESWNFIARLGSGAFETISGEIVKAILINLSRGNSASESSELFDAAESRQLIRGMDVSEPRTAEDKAALLVTDEIKSVSQLQQLENPDARVALEISEDLTLLSDFADSLVGIQTGDYPQFALCFWELKGFDNAWEKYERPGKSSVDRTEAVLWEEGEGRLYNLVSEKLGENGVGAWLRGREAWGRKGISVQLMKSLIASPYIGAKYDQMIATLMPKEESNLLPIWCFCSSPGYNEAVRQIDQSLKVTNATLVKVPFDLDYWTKVAEEQYPNGLPKPYTNDPTQWIFHGHPCGSVVWDEETKWTANSDLRIEDTVLQVAVARLLGYQWPAELDAEMDLANEQHAWVERCQPLNSFVDDDGIVCIPPVRGEKSADTRLEAMLEAAYGDQWTVSVRNQLLQEVGSKSLVAWLRDKFFEQHCKLFQHRPFIWHIWDGLKDGFSVLVNYHKLDKAGLERLIYTYLGDWIRTQQAAVNDGVDGADVKLGAAQTLKAELENILRGEKPYDIFVRWKSLSEQPIGWEPDLNDGVRLNIRPFMLTKDMGKKGAGLLRAKPNIKWTKDRGTDVESAPWYHLGPEYGEKLGARINEHHLSLAEKQHAKDSKGSGE